LVTVLVGAVVEPLGEPDGLIAFDPSRFPTRGTHSVGVKRQWGEPRGKVDPCQGGVSMAYVTRRAHAVLDVRWSRPEEWARDERRRQECHGPPVGRDHTRQAQGLERLDAWGHQGPHRGVTGDDALGRHRRCRGELRERGEHSGLGVPGTTTMRDLEAPWPEDQRRGRRPKAPWPAVTQWRHALPPTAWRRLTVRDGEQGPVAIAMVTRRVQTRLARQRTGPAAWLVVTRRPLADENGWEAQAARDATDHDPC
jgi:hypothetical protein